MKMKKGKTNGRSVIAFWPDSADAFRRDLPVAALPPCALRIQTRRQDGMALADVEEMTPLESWSGDAAAAEALLETARMLREKGWCVPLTPELVMTDGQGALRIVALPYREPSPGSIEELRARLLPPDDFDSFVEDSFDSFEPDSAGNGLPAAPARTEAQAGAGLNGPAAGFFDAPSGQGGAQTGSGMNGPAAGFFGTPSGQGGGAVKNDPETGFFGAPSGQDAGVVKNDPAVSFFGAPSGQGGGAVKNDPETGFFGAPSGQGGETVKNDPAAGFFGAPSGQSAAQTGTVRNDPTASFFGAPSGQGGGAVKNDPAASFFGAPSGQGAAQTGTVKNGPETDFFGAPVQAPPSRPAAVSPQFTDFFGNPVESTAGAAVPQPSQFTDFFGNPAQAPENSDAVKPVPYADFFGGATEPSPRTTPSIPGGFMDFFGAPAEEPASSASENLAEPSPECAEKAASSLDELQPEEAASAPISSGGFMDFFGVPAEELASSASENLAEPSPECAEEAASSLDETQPEEAASAPIPSGGFMDFFGMPAEEPVVETAVENAEVSSVTEPVAENYQGSPITENADEQSVPETLAVSTETTSADDFFSMWSTPEEEPTAEAVVGDMPIQSIAEPAEESIPVPPITEPAVEQSVPETPVVTTEAFPDPTSFEETTSADDFFSMWSTPEEPTVEAVVGDTPIPPIAELAEESIPVSPIAEPAVEQSAPETPVVTTEAFPDPTSFEETTSADDFFSMWSTPEEETTAEAVVEDTPIQPAAEPAVEQTAPEMPVVTTEATPGSTPFEETTSVDDFFSMWSMPEEETTAEAVVEDTPIQPTAEPVEKSIPVSPMAEPTVEQSVPETLVVTTEATPGSTPFEETTSADDFFSMWSIPEEEMTAETVVGDTPIQSIAEPAEESIPVSPITKPAVEQSAPEAPVVTTEAPPDPTSFEETTSADDFFSMWSTPEEPTAEAVVGDTPIQFITEPAEENIPVSPIAEPAVEQSAPETPVVTTEAPPDPTTFEETTSADDFFSMWSTPEGPTVEAVVEDTPIPPIVEPAEESIPVSLAADPAVEQSAPETLVVTTEATPDPTTFEETASADDFFSMWSTPEEPTVEAVIGDTPIPPTAEPAEESIPVPLAAEPVVEQEATPDPTSFEEPTSADDFFSMWSTPEEEPTAAAVAENPPSQPAAEPVAEAAVAPTSHVGQDDSFSGGYAHSTWDMVEDEPRPDSAPTSHVGQDDPFSGGYAHSTWDMVEDEPHPDSAPTSYVEQDDPFSGGYAHRSWDQAADGARPDSAPVSYDVQDSPFDGNGAWGEPEADVPAQDAPEASNGEAKQDPFRGKDGWESFSTAQDDDPFNMFTDGQPQPEERREDRRGRREKDGEPRERGGLLGFIRKKRAERSDEIDPDDPLMEFIDESGVQKRTASGQLYLSKKKGTTRGAIRVPREPSVVIGRTQGRGRLVIGDREISEEHAEISFDHGAYYLTDLNSTNGTFVNGEPLAQGRSVQLNQMDEISFGTKRFYALFVEEK